MKQKHLRLINVFRFRRVGQVNVRDYSYDNPGHREIKSNQREWFNRYGI